MSKWSSIGGRRRAWDILPLALLWTRKGGVFRNRLGLRLNVVQKGIIKKLGRHSSGGGALVYGDRELSFDETPVIRVKMSRPNSSMRFMIPCIKPHDFDYDYDQFDDDDDDDDQYDNAINHHDNGNVNEEEEEEVNGGCDDDGEGIDLKAEQFIAKFYEQMKLQRQISYLRYKEKGSSS